MKRFLLPIMSIMLIMLLFSACTKKKDTTTATATPTNKPLADVTPTANTTQAPTQAPEVTATPTINKLVYMIEDFDSMTDPLVGMKPANLENFGILYPEMILDTGYAEDGNALTVKLTPANWCQLFQIDDAQRISVFKENAKSEYYLRMYVANPSQIPILITAILTDGSLTSFIDATKVILTDIEGVVAENETSNATGNGEDSAITIPSDFTGWVAWPLNDEALKAWGGLAVKFSNLNTLTQISLDTRPVSPMEQDLYILDNLCVASTPS